MKNKWLDRALILTSHCYTLFVDPKDYYKMCDRYGIHYRGEFLDNACATTHMYTDINTPSGKQNLTMITVDVNRGATDNEVKAILSHEAVHVFERTIADLGETNPSEEFRAYSIQHISLMLFEEYDRQMKIYKRRKTPCT